MVAHAWLLLAVVPPVVAQSTPEGGLFTSMGVGNVQGRVRMQLAQYKVVKGARGAERFVPTQYLAPDDLVEYRATYTNASASALKAFVASLPIPPGAEYVPHTAKPSLGVQVCIQGGKCAEEPMPCKDPRGRSEPVLYREYRALRWSMAQLGPHASVVVSVRARVRALPKGEGPSLLPISPQRLSSASLEGAD